MIFNTFTHAALLASLFSSANGSPFPLTTRNGGVAVLDVFVPSSRNDDKFYNVNVTFNGQAVPVMIDTGSGDLFVASNECPTDDDQDGCFGLTSSYIIKVSSCSTCCLQNPATETSSQTTPSCPTRHSSQSWEKGPFMETNLFCGPTSAGFRYLILPLAWSTSRP